jgi:hypothetical protein
MGISQVSEYFSILAHFFHWVGEGVVYAHMISTSEQVETDFHRILKEYYATGGYPNTIHLHFLQCITKWQKQELVEWV